MGPTYMDQSSIVELCSVFSRSPINVYHTFIISKRKSHLRNTQLYTDDGVLWRYRSLCLAPPSPSLPAPPGLASDSPVPAPVPLSSIFFAWLAQGLQSHFKSQSPSLRWEASPPVTGFNYPCRALKVDFSFSH